MEKIKIDTPFIRLDALLKLAALAGTGGEAKTAVQEGLVKVNGQICPMRGRKLYSGDRVEYAGSLVEVEQNEGP